MLAGKNIVVTGAGRGIGKSIVEECIKNHANVWACVRKHSSDMEEWINRLCRENTGFVKPIIVDFLSEESIKEAGSMILNDKLTINGIVNNAGIIDSGGLFSMTSMTDVRKTFEVNFFGPIYFTQRLIKRLIHQKKGAIVNISSIAAIDGEPGQFGYVSSKAAVNGATKKLASELGQFGIRVNAIAPGVTDTSMADAMASNLKESTISRVALKRMAEPEEVAKMCVFLLSDESSFVTGQIIRVDGGML